MRRSSGPGRCFLYAAPSGGCLAFGLARRGAEEVGSVDLADASRQDWQRRPHDEMKSTRGSGRAATAFDVVRDALGLDVTRVDQSLYDLSPEALGTFDLVFMGNILRSEEHTSELQSLMRISYAFLYLKNKHKSKPN